MALVSSYLQTQGKGIQDLTNKSDFSLTARKSKQASNKNPAEPMC